MLNLWYRNTLALQYFITGLDVICREVLQLASSQMSCSSANLNGLAIMFFGRFRQSGRGLVTKPKPYSGWGGQKVPLPVFPL